MNFEDLDTDTQGIIDGMCHHTGKTRPEAILALVEIAMLSMKAAISSNHPFNNVQKKVMKRIFNAVNEDPKLKKTAEAYDEYWDVNV